MKESVSRDLAKYWWLQCVSCSEAALTTQMRGFGMEELVYEQALHAFSGGFMQLGNVCGLLTGAALAAGFQARERFADNETSATAALFTTICLARAFPELARSIDCETITQANFATLVGRLRYLFEGKGRLCGRLHLKWSSQAHELIDKSLTEFAERRPELRSANCAVKTLDEMAFSTEIEADNFPVVAGLAGGVGLLGNVCGALATGVFALSVANLQREESKTRDSRLRGSLQEITGSSFRGPATQLRLAFIDRFGSECCCQITKRQFESIEDYATFIEQGGCQEVSAFVAKWVEVHK